MKCLVLAGAALAFTLPVCADDTGDSHKIKGEGALNGTYTTGNTETKDLGLGLNLNRRVGYWKVKLEANADFGETDGEETRNRFYIGTQFDRNFSDRTYGFFRLSYEEDKFSGFSSRGFVGAGIGYAAIDIPTTKWTLETSPGLRLDEVEPIVDGDGMVLIPGSDEASFAVRFASNFTHRFNDAVDISNQVTATYADVSTQVTTTSAITAKLTDKLSGRLSFDVRHDTSPPSGFEATDTATRIGIVYAFGG